MVIRLVINLPPLSQGRQTVFERDRAAIFTADKRTQTELGLKSFNKTITETFADIDHPRSCMCFCRMQAERLRVLKGHQGRWTYGEILKFTSSLKHPQALPKVDLKKNSQ